MRRRFGLCGAYIRERGRIAAQMGALYSYYLRRGVSAQVLDALDTDGLFMYWRAMTEGKNGL